LIPPGEIDAILLVVTPGLVGEREAILLVVILDLLKKEMLHPFLSHLGLMLLLDHQ
jgi:hypothetical protein